MCVKVTDDYRVRGEERRDELAARRAADWSAGEADASNSIVLPFTPEFNFRPCLMGRSTVNTINATPPSSIVPFVYVRKSVV